MKSQGMFITFEGINGSGKTTLAGMLADWLKKKGHKVWLTKEPWQSDYAKQIRKGEFKDAVDLALLFALDRKMHSAEIRKRLDNGYTVISDRYLLSSYAYQGAQGVPSYLLKKVNKLALAPDVQFILDAPLKTALDRTDEDPLFKDKPTTFWQRVEEGFLKFRKEKGVYVVDTSKSASISFSKIKSLMAEKI